MSVQGKIVLGTLCVFNGLTLAILGFLSLFFVDGASGPVVAVMFWLTAALLFWLSRWLRRGPEWE